ncbi:MAG: ABC transporter ATP-binding protein [Candidatus Methylomirabilales bacterium]
MSDIAIQVERLAKRYTIGALQYRPDTLREAVVESLRWVCSWNGHGHPGRAVLWALQDVSFEVRRGEVLGLIGANGSGKSTLLKLLARITEPTSGRARMFGRVAALLEVGTGFDRELTGRENIYLSGAVLGMRRAEIKHKFDEIVAFSEVERFIDTPVKRYSSGMYVRLAFAVAAHLDPEILLIDEVLAVGDARFQKKSLARMQEVARSGRTVVFVSHNMSAITQLCTRTILLRGGRLVEDGASHRVAGLYLTSGPATPAVREWPDPATAPRGPVARLRAVRVRTAEGVSETADIQEEVALEMEYDVLEGGHVLLAGFRLENDADVHLFDTLDLDPAWRQRPRPRGRYLSRVTIPGNFLSEARYFVNASLAILNSHLQFHERHVVSFQVVEGPEGGAARGDYFFELKGALRPVLPWTTQFTPAGSPAAGIPTEASRP